MDGAVSSRPPNFTLFVRAPADTPHWHRLKKLGLSPARKRQGLFVGRYHHSAKPQLLRHIAMLKQLGLHGVAKAQRR